jgi:FixJ family two-component response regulator
MDITILSDNTKIKQEIESYTNDIFIKQTNSATKFFQEIQFSKPNLLIIDTNSKNLTETYQKIKDDTQVKDLDIVFLVEKFDFKFFQKLGFSIGDVDYIQNPIEINQLISKVNSYNYLFKLENKTTNIDNFITKYSQSVIKGEMFGIVSHQWRQPLNIIATSIINIELKSELEQIKHCDIEHCVEKIHSTLERITNMFHNFEDIFKISNTKSEFNISEVFTTTVDLILPQLNSHKIKIINNISKKNYKTINYKNELSQSILCILSIIKDLIKQKYQEDNNFNGSIKLQIESNSNDITLKIINKKIDISNELFQNSLSLDSSNISYSNEESSKLFIAKKIIENRLNGNLRIVNESKDIIYTITI